MSARHQRMLFAAVFALLVSVTVPARAEVGEVTIAQQYGVAFLPLMWMEHNQLIEKHAKAQGIELAHLAFVDKTQTVQIARCLVDSFKNSALSPGFCFHGKSPVTNHPVPLRRAACLPGPATAPRFPSTLPAHRR